MEKQNLIITIGRQYGSGGAEVGKKLGQRMGLDVYDKEILKMTSDESGIRESYFHLADERAGKKLLYKIVQSLISGKYVPFHRLRPGIRRQSVPVPVRGHPASGPGGILYFHWPLRRPCAGGNRAAGEDLHLRGHGGQDPEDPGKGLL